MDEPRKTRKWSPEAREAHSKLMTERWAMKAKPSSAERVSPEHGDYIGKRKDGLLLNSDWPDIKNMIPKMTREAIAMKYGTTTEHLNVFIAEKCVSDSIRPDSPPATPREEPKWSFAGEDLETAD